MRYSVPGDSTSTLHGGHDEEDAHSSRAMTLLMTGMAYAQAEPPVIDQQQMNQKQRIDQGIAIGKLTE